MRLKRWSSLAERLKQVGIGGITLMQGIRTIAGSKISIGIVIAMERMPRESSQGLSAEHRVFDEEASTLFHARAYRDDNTESSWP